jgi:hypothetical protein
MKNNFYLSTKRKFEVEKLLRRWISVQDETLHRMRFQMRFSVALLNTT